MEPQFSDKIEFETVQLEVASDVVRYSFIAQKSLTQLDLSTCEYTLERQPVFTEEQCRKLIEPRRQILYELHLDLPKNLECSLRDVVPNVDDHEEQYEAFHLGVMMACECVYSRNLAKCIIKPIMSAVNRIEKLRRFMNIIRLLNLEHYRMDAVSLFDYLIRVLYPTCRDSNLVVELAISLRFCTWIFYEENPWLVSYVLQHAMRIRCNLWQVSYCGLDPVNGCIFSNKPRNVLALLQYGTELEIDHLAYRESLGTLLLNRRIVRRIVQSTIPDRNYFLMLQLFYYYNFNHPSGEELLHVWRSIPDSYISEKDISFLLGNVVSSRRLRHIIEFYKYFIVEESDDINDITPRRLQHLCRIAIRLILNRNYQLPNGIYLLGLPCLMRNYLNLKS